MKRVKRNTIHVANNYLVIDYIMSDFSKTCNLRASSKNGAVTKPDLEKMAMNLGVEHKKKINKSELCEMVLKKLQRIGR